MNRKRVFAVLFLLGLFVLPSGAYPGGASEPSPGATDLRARGEYLVTFGACNDCHSPKLITANGPVPDPARLLSGHIAGKPIPSFDRSWVEPGKWVLLNDDFTAFVGPWGITYAANLTPDDQTGIGLWTQDVFVNAMRTGKHMGAGRPIQPPMPWQMVATLTDEDLAAVFTYLKSLPPIKNPVPANVPMDQIKTSMR